MQDDDYDNRRLGLLYIIIKSKQKRLNSLVNYCMLFTEEENRNIQLLSSIVFDFEFYVNNCFRKEK